MMYRDDKQETYYLFGTMLLNVKMWLEKEYVCEMNVVQELSPNQLLSTFHSNGVKQILTHDKGSWTAAKSQSRQLTGCLGYIHTQKGISRMIHIPTTHS